LGAALGISEAITSNQPPEKIVAVISDLRDKLGLEANALQTVIRSLPQHLEDHCAALQVALPELDAQLGSLDVLGASMCTKLEAPEAAIEPALGAQQSVFDEYVQEIRQALANNEPTASIVATVMEACAYCLKFDRVILLLANQGRRQLLGRMSLGQIPDVDPTKLVRPLGEEADAYAPDSNAFVSGIPVFQGDPLFKGGWPITAIPIGAGKRAVGVVYAERVAGPQAAELSVQEQAAISLLATLLDKSVQRVANMIS
jgi:GAF domain-containing protein